MLKKTLTLCGIAAMSIAAAGAAFASDYSYKMTIPKLTESPTLDGVVTGDPGWLEAALSGGKFVMDVNHAGDTMTALPRICYVGYDNAALWVSFLVFSGAELSGPSADGEGLWGDDQVEVFFQRGPEGAYGHVGINVSGSRTVEKGEEGWDLEAIKTKAKKDGIVTSIEARIPFSAVGGAPKAGEKWRINLNGHQVDGDLWLASNPTYGGFHNPDRFMDATFQ